MEQLIQLNSSDRNKTLIFTIRDKFKKVNYVRTTRPRMKTAFICLPSFKAFCQAGQILKNLIVDFECSVKVYNLFV